MLSNARDISETTRPAPADERRAGPKAGSKDGPKAGRERRCLVSRETLATERLIRFVVGPDGAVVPDVGCVLPGRGLWLTAQRDIVAAACARNVFARAARASVAVPDDLADRVEHLLLDRALNSLGLARRAGQVALGFEVVRDWLRQGRAALLLTASDAAPGGARKIKALALDLPHVGEFASAELGRALGRDSVVHVAIARGRLAGVLRADAERLAGFRAGHDQADARQENGED